MADSRRQTLDQFPGCSPGEWQTLGRGINSQGVHLESGRLRINSQGVHLESARLWDPFPKVFTLRQADSGINSQGVHLESDRLQDQFPRCSPWERQTPGPIPKKSGRLRDQFPRCSPWEQQTPGPIPQKSGRLRDQFPRCSPWERQTPGSIPKVFTLKAADSRINFHLPLSSNTSDLDTATTLATLPCVQQYKLSARTNCPNVRKLWVG